MDYPSLGALKRWIKDYEQDAKTTLDGTRRKRKSKYSDAQRQAAVDHFFEHGQFITKTVKALGYPSRQLLREWLLEDPRCDNKLRSRTVVNKPAASEEVKAKAVEALYKREVPAREIAKDFDVSRETLYGCEICLERAFQQNRHLAHQMKETPRKSSAQRSQVFKLVSKSLSFKMIFFFR